jgi:hypothetical protein
MRAIPRAVDTNDHYQPGDSEVERRQLPSCITGSGTLVPAVFCFAESATQLGRSAQARSLQPLARFDPGEHCRRLSE